MAMSKSGNMVFLIVMMALAATISLSDAQTVHVVGDEMGWGIPDGGFLTYTTWAATQNFTVGDILVFNFTTGNDDVAQVTREAFLLCNTTVPVIFLSKTGPTNITLDTAGEHFYFCTFDKRCEAGQRLAINVTEAAAPSPPSPPEAPTPESAPTPAPSRSPMNYTVGDVIGWVIPGDPIVYQTWAADKNFMVGDTLVFNFIEELADVAEVTKTAFENCDSNTTIANYTKSPAMITLTTSGEHFFVSTFANNVSSSFPNSCQLGQQLAINVTGTSTASPPATPPSPTASPPATPPSPTASPPATPPSPTASPPTTTAKPPTSTATPPSTTTAPTPSSQISPGTGVPGNDASSFAAAAGFTATFLSIAVAYLLN